MSQFKYHIVKQELKRTISSAWASYIIHCNEHNAEMKAKRPSWSADGTYPRELNSVYIPYFLKIFTLKGGTSLGPATPQPPEIKVIFDEESDEEAVIKYFTNGVLEYDKLMAFLKQEVDEYLATYGDMYDISKMNIVITTYHSKKLNKTFKEVYSFDVE